MKGKKSQDQWLLPVILAAWEAKNKRIMVPGQPEQESLQNPVLVE
jgi:hypothetical protein